MTAEFGAHAGRRTDDAGQDPVVVHVSGELDIQHADKLEGLLAAALASAEPSTAIIVDLSNSSFCDSSGLNVLIRAREAGLRTGHTLSLAAPNHQMLRLLDLTGTAPLFPVGPAVAG
ncbi:STAS domain-containing protein [Streptomyces sp. NPDC012637]|uniref:STAS domain-containing protein n=1 Tax=Streptomyces sp. NPDC012637 TaxID=3364842 RepID=UPI0036E8C782